MCSITNVSELFYDHKQGCGRRRGSSTLSDLPSWWVGSPSPISNPKNSTHALGFQPRFSALWASKFNPHTTLISSYTYVQP